MSVCVCVVTCGCVYMWVLQYMSVCMYGLCSLWVCVCEGGFVRCGCVYVWVCNVLVGVCMGFVMCGCVYVWVL